MSDADRLIWGDRVITVPSADPAPGDSEAPETAHQAVAVVSMTWFAPEEDPNRPANGESVTVDALTSDSGTHSPRPHLHGRTTLRVRPVTAATPGLGELCAATVLRERIAVRLALLHIPPALSEWLAYWLPAYAELWPTGDGRVRMEAHAGMTAWWRHPYAGHPVRFDVARMKVAALYAPTSLAGNVFGTVSTDGRVVDQGFKFFRLSAIQDGTPGIPHGV